MPVELSHDGAVAVVTISRPEARNALNTAINRELLTTARTLAHDDGVRAVVLTGAGDVAFVAGADIKEFRDMSPEQARQSSWLGRKVIEAIEGAPQPWIAAVNGFALGGGCELALACDIRFASDNARFGQPEVGLGITPGWGGTQRLPREVGNGWASYLCLSGRLIDAEQALRMGLVQAVCAQAELMDEARKLAVELAAKPPLAVRYIKSQIHHALNVDIEAGHEIERDLFSLAFASEDRLEGMDAFLEKRAPKGFAGR
ncbi:MAG TPA: enoyl-CoA hydratase-related protein [Thermoleophilia bacterium]|nr:enoyl-CoA hydratase-related protein [Thermoleophilia bacterium]